MKNIAAIALFVAASFITAGSAIAQDHAVKATVPFNFIVSGSSMPAGNYTLSSDNTTPYLLQINDREKGIHAMAVTLGTSSEEQKANVLVFHRYGNQYFLSEIRSETSSMYVRLAPTKQEKRLSAETQQAGVRTSGDVMVALY